MKLTDDQVRLVTILSEKYEYTLEEIISMAIRLVGSLATLSNEDIERIMADIVSSVKSANNRRENRTDP